MLVIAAYATWRLNWMDWHAYAGYALLALVVFRLLCAARGRLPSLAAEARPGIPGRISVTTRQQPIEQTVHWLPQSGVAHSFNV